MPKKTYIGVDNTAKQVKKMYIGVDNVAKKVKKAYIGINGYASPIFGEGKPTYNQTLTLNSDTGNLFGRGELAATSLKNKKIFFAGGFYLSGNTIGASHFYSTSLINVYNTSTYTQSFDSLQNRASSLGAGSTENISFFAGGINRIGLQTKSINTIEIIDIENTHILLSNEPLSSAKYNFGTAATKNIIGFAGGSTISTSTTSFTNQCDFYNNDATKLMVNYLNNSKHELTGIGFKNKMFFGLGRYVYKKPGYVSQYLSSDSIDIFDEEGTKTLSLNTDNTISGPHHSASKTNNYVIFGPVAFTLDGSKIILTNDGIDGYPVSNGQGAVSIDNKAIGYNSTEKTFLYIDDNLIKYSIELKDKITENILTPNMLQDWGAASTDNTAFFGGGFTSGGYNSNIFIFTLE